MKVDRVFDERIFLPHYFLINHVYGNELISVNNEADKWILSNFHKHNNVKVDACNEANIHLNPKLECIGTNIYTINRAHHTNVFLLPYLKFFVLTDQTYMNNKEYNMKQLNIENFDKNLIFTTVFTVNPNLTDLEHAIMLKFYSINMAQNGTCKDNKNLYINITTELFDKIFNIFHTNDVNLSIKRQWFTFDKNSKNVLLYQLPNGELRSFSGNRTKIHNMPYLYFYSAPLQINI